MVRAGEPVEVRRKSAAASGPDDWTRRFEENLAAAQNALAGECQRRNPGDFQQIIRGGAGQGGVYDAWRMFIARLRGKKFSREHGRK